MDLADGDYIVGAEVVGEESLILSISEKGYGKRTKLSEYRLTHRNGKGVINMKATRKIGKRGRRAFGQGRFRVDDRHQERPDDPASIRRRSASTGRSASGVRLVNMDDDDQRCGRQPGSRRTIRIKNGDGRRRSG